MKDKANKNINWQEIDEEFKKIVHVSPDGLKPGNYCKVVCKYSNDITYGLIVYENQFWRELQIGNNFKIFSFENHKFARHYE